MLSAFGTSAACRRRRPPPSPSCAPSGPASTRTCRPSQVPRLARPGDERAVHGEGCIRTPLARYTFHSFTDITASLWGSNLKLQLKHLLKNYN